MATLRRFPRSAPWSSLAAGLLLGWSVASLAAQTPAGNHGGTPDFVSTRPTVRVEYWQQRLADITVWLANPQSLAGVKLLFLGDSITDFWTMGENPWFPGQQMGRKIWQESFAGSRPENLGSNLGISGDRTEHLLYRLLPKAQGGLGELDSPELNPDFVVLMVGVNNTWNVESPVEASVVAGVRAVLRAVRERKPGATVILESLLPLNDQAKNDTVIRPVNRRLQDMIATPPFAGHVVYLDLYSAFVDGAGKQVGGHFADGVHPNESGYRIWRDSLVRLLDQQRAGRRSPEAP